MNGTFYDQAARGLPNFPREVMKRWFEHVESAGWPPPFDANGFAIGAWRERVFRDRFLGFWQGTSWALEHHPLTLVTIEPETRDIVNALAGAFAIGLPHPIDISIADASQRIGGFVAALVGTGRLPVPPILLATTRGFEVLDGFHRLAALAYARAASLRVDHIHDAWVARHPSAA